MNEKKAFQNAQWIIGCNILKACINLIVGMLSARYLGPANYGLINYASSVIGFVVPIMQLGLRSTLVQEYISRPEMQGTVTGTALGLNLMSSLACMVSVALFVRYTSPGEPETLLIVVLYSISLPFQAVEMIQYWFQAKLLSKFPSMAMLLGYAVVSVYKIILLIRQRSVYWFALSYAIEYAVEGGLLLCIYRKKTLTPVSFSWPLAKELFAKGKYYIVSGLMTMIFANTDHVMLKQMIGDTENGFYSAAFSCASVLNFVYAAITDSARPLVLESKKKSKEQFENTVSGLYSLIIYMGLAQSGVFTLFSGLIIRILYGDAYAAAIPVLRIIVWYLAFSYMGTVRNIWILAEGKQSILWIINLSGAMMNVLLNALMIPHWQACGAALASVLTQFFTNFIVGFFIRPIRPNNALILRGLDPRGVWRLLGSLLKKKPACS